MVTLLLLLCSISISTAAMLPKVELSTIKASIENALIEIDADVKNSPQKNIIMINCEKILLKCDLVRADGEKWGDKEVLEFLF